MKKQLVSLAFITITLLGLFITGCQKPELVTPEKQEAFFVNNPATGTYRITAAGQVFKIPVGITRVSDQDRTINFTVSSSTGAQAGTHYNLAGGNSITIRAGQAIDSIEVRAVFSQYQAGRKDTLVFSISEADKSPNIRSSYRLAVSGPCFEGDVNLNTFLGEYKNTREDFGGAYGPYTTRVTAVSSTGPTTGTITVANLFDAGWNTVTFTLDWSNPSNRIITLNPQTGIGDGGTISATYAGQDIQVRNHSNGQRGTFSVCNQTITLRMQLGITGLGFFNTMYTVNMAR